MDSHSLHPNKKIENLPHNLYKTRIGKLIKCTCMSLKDKPHQPHHALMQIFFLGGGGASAGLSMLSLPGGYENTFLVSLLLNQD